MSEQRTDLAEAIKVGFEAAKQLTTLNAGAIVVIGTFLSDIFPSDKQGTAKVPWYIKLLIAGAFVGFGLSLVNSTTAMVTYRNAIEDYLLSISQRIPWVDFFEERTILFFPLLWCENSLGGGSIFMVSGWPGKGHGSLFCRRSLLLWRGRAPQPVFR